MGVLADAFIRVRIDASGMKADVVKEATSAGEEGGRSFASGFSKGSAVAAAGVAGVGIAATGAFGAVAGGAALAGIAIASIGLKAILAGEQMKATFEKFGQDVQKQMAEIAKPLQPVLTTFMSTVKDTLTGLTPVFQEAFSALAPALQSTIKTIGATLVQLGPAFAQIAKSSAPFIEALGTGLSGALKAILPAVASLFQRLEPMAPLFAELVSGFGALLVPVMDVVGALAQLGGPIVGQVVNLLGTVLGGLAKALVPLFAQLTPIIGDLIDSVSALVGSGLQILTQILGLAAQLFVQLYKAVAPLIPVLLELAVNIFSNLLKFLQPLMPMIGELVAALGETLLQALKALLPGVLSLQDTIIQLLPALLPLVQAALQLAMAFLPLVPAIAQIASVLIQALLPALIPIIESTAKLATQLIDVLVPAIQFLVKWLVGPLVAALGVAISWLGEKLLEPIGKAAAWLIDRLVPAFEATWRGIVAGAQWFVNGWQDIWDSVTSAASGVADFFRGVWNAVLDVTNAVTRSVQSAWDAVVSFFKGTLMPAVEAVYNATFKPVMDGITVVVRNAWVAVENVFKLWIAFMDITWGNAIRAAGALISTVWNAIQTTIRTVWDFIRNNILQPALAWLTGTWNTTWTAVSTFLTNTWNAIRNMIQTAWNFVQNNILQPALAWLRGTFQPAWDALRQAVTTAWNGLRDAIQAGWTFIRENIFQPVITFITQTIPSAFQSGVAAIGRWWNGLKELAAAPVRFVIDTVINRGIIDSVNRVTGALGHNANLSHLPGLAEGGPLPGPRSLQRKDNMLAWGPNGPLALQSGEYVMPTDRTAKYFPILEAMRRGTYPGYKDGGIIGDIVSGVSNFFGDVVSLFADPLKTILGAAGIDGIVGKFGNSPFVSGLRGVPEKIMEAVVAWFNTNKDKLISGDAGKGTWTAQPFGWPGGNGNQPPWAANTAAAASHIQARFPGQPAGSYVSPYGWSDHFPKAIDLMTNAHTPAGLGRGNQIVAEAVRTAAAYGLKYIIWNKRFTSGLGWEPYAVNGQGDHSDHVHLSYYKDGGRLGSRGFASGGTIPEPIVGVGRSGRRYTFGENGPETVIPNGAGVNLTVVVQGSVTDKEVAAIKSHVDDAFRTFKTQITTGRRK